MDFHPLTSRMDISLCLLFFIPRTPSSSCLSYVKHAGMLCDFFFSSSSSSNLLPQVTLTSPGSDLLRLLFPPQSCHPQPWMHVRTAQECGKHASRCLAPTPQILGKLIWAQLSLFFFELPDNSNVQPRFKPTVLEVSKWSQERGE